MSGGELRERKKLATYAWKAYLNDPQAAGALSPDEFVTVCTLAVQILPKEDAATLKLIVQRKFPAAADIQALSIQSLERLTIPLATRLAFTKDQTGGWLASWVGGKEGEVP